MQYINYPAKTLMKSSRVVFTMFFGVLIQRKVYKSADYAIVAAMVIGLAMFMHADANSSAVFHHMGVIMLTVSLVCDGAISNVSETIMTQFGVGQDEVRYEYYFITRESSGFCWTFCHRVVLKSLLTVAVACLTTLSLVHFPAVFHFFGGNFRSRSRQGRLALGLVLDDATRYLPTILGRRSFGRAYVVGIEQDSHYDLV
jgi:hypothetical protein